MQFLGSLTPCPTPVRSCHRPTCMTIAVIACDHVLYVVVVALCVFVGVECGWCYGCEFLGCLGALGGYSAGRKRGETTLT